MSTADFVIKTSIDSENYFCSKLINNSHEPIESFMFCFSVLAPVKVIENCVLHFSSGGYAELKPNKGFVLKPGEEWNLKYAYEESRHKPMNHRWSPQGCFIKTDNERIFNLNVIDLDLERISSVAPVEPTVARKVKFFSIFVISLSVAISNILPTLAA